MDWWTWLAVQPDKDAARRRYHELGVNELQLGDLEARVSTREMKLADVCLGRSRLMSAGSEMQLAIIVVDARRQNGYQCRPDGALWALWPACQRGGIGRRSVFKIHRPQGCAGSSPAAGTTKKQ